MCGIFGAYLTGRDRLLPPALLPAMGEALRHRGPDDDGFLEEGNFGFGMRRLSIIDLKTGHQPIRNEDGNIHVVLNGEIYNYRELIPGLVAKGHTFYTASDTEVIVHLYEEYGTACVESLRGMFAIAIWDRRARTLLLARDRLGIKPLYYAEIPAGFLFASELKALLQWRELDSQINPDGLREYLRYGYVPEPLTILKHIWKLPAAHFAVVKDGHLTQLRSYWEPASFFEHPMEGTSEDDLTQELGSRLKDAVQSHLISDVPVGAFLSGGIDSSAVVALIASVSAESVKTFAIGFEHPGYDERPYARSVAERFGTEHHDLVVRPGSLDALEHILSYFDEPFADSSAIPTYVVSQLAAEHVKVVLSGDGGDEMFAGYDRYVVDHQRRRYDSLRRLGLSPALRAISRTRPDGAFAKDFLFNISLDRMSRYIESVSRFSPRRQRELLVDGLASNHGSADPTDVFEPHLIRSRNLDFPTRLQYLDTKTYLPGDILTKVDRMSMAHSIEARVPLLDHRLVEFAARLPSRYQLNGTQTKYLFRRALAGLLPQDILRRRKTGFGVPLQYWFRERLATYMKENLLGRDDSLRHGYFNRQYVERLFQTMQRTDKETHLDRLWTLLVFETWYRTSQERHPVA